MSRWDLPADLTLESLADKWLEDIASTIDADTAGLYRLHIYTHISPHFRVPDGIRTSTIADYGRRRLRVVKRSTLQKERSTLRGFLAWCQEQGYLADPPEFPVLPRRAMGTAFATRRRGAATDLTPDECRALIAALPQWSRPRASNPSFPVRARFVVAYETALRPATLDALSVPEHYSRGAETLVITDEIDKARFGRTLPLTGAARVALDSVCRPGRTGLVFGDHDYRWQLKKAAKAINLPAGKLRTFCAYDLRHNRLTELAEGGNLTGVAYLAGHKRVTTTSIYVRPGLKAGERALQPFDKTRVSKGERLVGDENIRNINDCAKERTRTSTGVTPLAPQSNAPGKTSAHVNSLRAEAVAILGAAAAGDTVTEDRLRDMARGAIGLSAIGRLALGVLDGGPYAPRRAIELARLIVDGQARLERKDGGT
jgi:integrase